MLNILLALALVLLLIGGAILAAALKAPLFKYPEPILASAVLPLLAEVPKQRPDAAPSGWG